MSKFYGYFVVFLFLMMMMTVNLYSVLRKKAPLLRRGVATGIYRYIYHPKKKKSVYLTNFVSSLYYSCFVHMWDIKMF